MPSIPVLLHADTDSAWRLFQSDTHSSDDRGGDRGHHLELVQRWRRARERGRNRRGPSDRNRRGPSDQNGLETYPEDLSQRRRRLESIWSEGRELLDEVVEDFSSRGIAIAIADRDGIILRCLGGGSFANASWDLHLREGADWSEAARGTNAMGTSLEEKRPFGVVGPAHLDQQLHALAGYACPLLDEAGEPVGVIGAFSLLPMQHPTALASIITIAHQLEKYFQGRSRSSSREVLSSRIRDIVERCPTPALLVRSPGHLLFANGPARTLLDLATVEDEPVPIREILGLGWHELESTARDSGVDAVAHLPAKPRSDKAPAISSVRLRLQPIFNGSDSLISILAFLEGSRSHSRESGQATYLEVGDWPEPDEGPFGRIFGRDPGLRAAIHAATRFAGTTLPILLLAETGTGKDLMAHAIHDASPRLAGPFVPLNCGALSANLLESELFGYDPGAFTGASRKGREGKIAAAEGGTLFLDEVAEMPAPLQAMLLRVLEDGTYYRVGGNRPRKADIRLICATCRSLPELVAQGSFRKDLYYRIKGACLSLPPLRDRTDVGDLTLYLLGRLMGELFPGTYPRIDPEAFEWIQRNDWPGNVRELKTSLHHAAVLARGTIRMEHLPVDLVGIAGSSPAPSPASHARVHPPALDLREVETATLRRAIEAADGNLSRAAQELGIARTTLYRKMKRYGLRPA